MIAPTHTLTSIVGWAEQGNRGFCWRAECREANGQYRTITYETGPVVVARCHRGEYRTFFDFHVEVWAHAG